jgi:hypothetical protein
MHLLKRSLLILIAGFLCHVVLARPTTTLSFTVEAFENVAGEFPGAPRLQSFSFAQWKGRWVFIGGRVGGYHAVGGRSAEFLRADSNRDVWVVDTTVKPARTYHVAVDQLPPRLAAVSAQWTSTAQLYFQDGRHLYISGGYGQDENGKWTTFDVISRVSLPELVESVMHGRLPAESVAFARSPLVQSAGGGLMKLADGYFYLLMGHVFQGSYTTFEGQAEHNSAEASQTYLNEIRKLSITIAGDGNLNVALAGRFREDTEFHRRDLNVVPLLSPAGLGVAAYGGVFTPDSQTSFSKPIYVAADKEPVVDRRFDQKLNAYSTAVMLSYSASSGTMYSTFFGGISRYVWNPLKSAFEENIRAGYKADATYLDGLQWSDQISTLEKTAEETTETVHPTTLPAFLGAGAVFIPAPEFARAEPGTDILALDSLPQPKTFAGYIYGGIRAYPYQFPYLKTAPAYNSGAVPSQTSDMILKVYVERSR